MLEYVIAHNNIENMMIYTKKILLVLFTQLFLLSAVNSYALTAEDAVKETTQEVLARLQADRDKLKSHPEHIETIVRELIVPHFDFEIMSRLVLYKHWQTISNLNKACFITGLRDLLVGRYADIFLGYADKEIIYEPEDSIVEKGYVSVRQIISRTGIEPFYVDYPMRPEGNEWKVVDIVIDGVSMLKSYRATFKRDIQKQGLDSFIEGFQVCNK